MAFKKKKKAVVWIEGFCPNQNSYVDTQTTM
jgi:hypothetical protein